MAVRNFAARRCRWKRLVGLALLLLCFRASPADDIPFRVQGRDGVIYEFAFLGLDTIQRSGCSRFFARPEVYLLFLPGLLVCGFKFFTRKKRGLAIILVSVILFASADDPFPRRTVERGMEAFTAGDYEGSRMLLEEAAGVVPCNAALLYDIALCHFVLDHLGEAIYFLRESIRANPQAKHPREVLSRIEQEKGLATQIKPPMALHPNIPFALTLLFFNLFFIGLGFLLSNRRGWIFIMLVFSALLTIASLSMFAGTLIENRKPVAVVTAAEGAMKKIPLLDVKPWMQLPQGTALRLSGETVDYMLVRTEDGLTGWIEKNAVLRSVRKGGSSGYR